MSKRDDVVNWAHWGCDHEPDIHYTEGETRMEGIGNPGMLPLDADCSAFVTDCFNWAGAPDPNGMSYNGFGFTGTLLQHNEHITLAQARRGDLIVYGPGGGDHVVMHDDDDGAADPWTVSHGQERGPVRVRHSVEVRSHRQPFTVLRCAGLDTEGLHMDKDVQDRFDAIDANIAAVTAQVNKLTEILWREADSESVITHVEKMLGSEITVVNQIQTDVTNIRAKVEAGAHPPGP